MAQFIEATNNLFGGVVTIPGALPDDPSEFQTALRRSLDLWSSEGIRVVWLEVPISKAALVPVAVEAGFSYHHAGEQYLMLTHRLACQLMKECYRGCVAHSFRNVTGEMAPSAL